MRINHNIVALNTHRVLAASNSAQSKSMEKLSSGLRINRAGDDAAGLAISEKMQAQIKGLNQAQRNSQDAISMINTAEGAASVVHDMLQRGRELAVQAANDTLTDSDRQALNEELTQLKEQISKVANDTEFNTIKMLNKGAVSSGNATLVATIKDRLENWIDDSLSVISNELGLDIAFGTAKDMKVEFYENSASSAAAASMGTNDGGNSLILRINMSKVSQVYNDTDYGWGQVDALIAHEVVHALQFTKMPETLNGGIDTWFIEGMATAIQGGVPFLNSHSPMSSANIPTGSTWTGDYGSAYAAVMTLHEITTGGLGAIVDRLEVGDTLSEAIAGTTQSSTAELSNVTNFTNTTTAAADFANWFNSSTDVDDYLDTSADFTNPIGTIASGQGSIRAVTIMADVITNNTTIENGNPFNYIYTDSDSSGDAFTFQVGSNTGQTISLNTVDLTVEGLAITSTNLSTRHNANQAIEILDSAIGKVSTIRSTFGAVQNRLEHTINNLNTSSENLTAAESRIRDVDMAKEMMEQTKNSILSQAAQAMLAQANQQSQGVLQLLR